MRSISFLALCALLPLVRTAPVSGGAALNSASAALEDGLLVPTEKLGEAGEKLYGTAHNNLDATRYDHSGRYVEADVPRGGKCFRGSKDCEPSGEPSAPRNTMFGSDAGQNDWKHVDLSKMEHMGVSSSALPPGFSREQMSQYRPSAERPTLITNLTHRTEYPTLNPAEFKTVVRHNNFVGQYFPRERQETSGR